MVVEKRREDGMDYIITKSSRNWTCLCCKSVRGSAPPSYFPGKTKEDAMLLGHELGYRIRSFLNWQSISMDDAACEIVTVCPEETQAVTPAVFPEDHLDRVVSPALQSTMEKEIRRISRTSVRWAATRVHLFKKAILSDEVLYVGKYRARVGRKKRFSVSQGLYPWIERAGLMSSVMGQDYFGHYLSDDMSRALLMEQFGVFIQAWAPPYHHAKSYEDTLSPHSVHCYRARFGILAISRDIGQNSHKRARYLQLRDRMAKAIITEKVVSKIVYIVRGTIGNSRTLANEDQVVDHFIKRGAGIVNSEKMQVKEIINTLWNASIVVSVEGSQINHALYPMATDGSILVLQPPRQFNNIHKDFCDCLGRGYGFYVCEDRGKEFYLDDFGALDRLIDMLIERKR